MSLLTADACVAAVWLREGYYKYADNSISLWMQVGQSMISSLEDFNRLQGTQMHCRIGIDQVRARERLGKSKAEGECDGSIK